MAFGEAVVEAPFGRKPDWKRRFVRPEDLLDTGASRDAGYLGMCDPSIFADLTEQVLAIDELQRATPERLKGKSEPLELAILPVLHAADDVFSCELAGILEAFGDAVTRTGAGNDEAVLGKVDQRRVIDVDRKLEGEKIAERGQLLKRREDLFERPRLRQSIG